MSHPKRCLSCEILHGERTPPGVIIETNAFHAHQDIAYPVPGMVIVASKRHFRCLDEMTEKESRELAQLMRRIRIAQRYVLRIEHVYYFYNEDTTHHFHVWMVPRYEWMSRFGRSVESVRPSLLHAKHKMSNNEALTTVTETVRRLRDALCSDGGIPPRHAPKHDR